MEFKNIFERYEIKYLMTRQQQYELYNLMVTHMQPDTFGKSTIYNIYYDTPDRRLIRKSLDGPCYKEKLRVRSYGVAKSESTVFIELKKKYNGIVYKRRMDLNERLAHNYLEHSMGVGEKSQIGKEIEYFMKFYEQIEPSVFLSYEREAFVGKEDPDFRMTFDKNILMRDYDMDLKLGAYGETLLDDNMILLEIKTACGIPEWLLGFLSENQIYKTSFSKYGCAYQKFLLPRQFCIGAGEENRTTVIEKENGGKKDVA
ncbi:MAG TPA: polyphosphate polymerase domain-containing protein [Lachnospiraceae bacterium]|nr:polyphosphate polymerase domain-containing protein [Lachnospiraceae bacterium]